MKARMVLCVLMLLSTSLMGANLPEVPPAMLPMATVHTGDEFRLAVMLYSGSKTEWGALSSIEKLELCMMAGDQLKLAPKYAPAMAAAVDAFYIKSDAPTRKVIADAARKRGWIH